MTPDKIRSAVVTGVSSGIGAGIASALLRAGWAVVGVSRARRPPVIELERDHGERFVAVMDDVRRPELASELIACAAGLGRLGAVVCAAGLGVVRTAFINTEPAAIKEMFDVNVLGSLWLAREAARHYADRNEPGDIVFISSVAGLCGRPNESAYSASKGAISLAADAIRQELAPLGIRVLEVVPGTVETRFLETTVSPDKAAEIYRNTATVQVDDIARVVEWSLSQPPHVALSQIVVRPSCQIT